MEKKIIPSSMVWAFGEEKPIAVAAANIPCDYSYYSKSVVAPGNRLMLARDVHKAISPVAQEQCVWCLADLTVAFPHLSLSFGAKV